MTSRTQNGGVAFGHEASISLFHRLAARFTKIRPSLKSVLLWSEGDRFLASVWLKHEAERKAGVSPSPRKRRPGFLRRYQ